MISFNKLCLKEGMKRAINNELLLKIKALTPVLKIWLILNLDCISLWMKIINPAVISNIAGIIVNTVHSIEKRPCNWHLFPFGNYVTNKKGAKLITNRIKPIIKIVILFSFFNFPNIIFSEFTLWKKIQLIVYNVLTKLCFNAV